MSHNARQQKKLAKLKAKRTEKRQTIARQTSNDPTIRLAGAADWPVIDSLVGQGIFDSGLGTALVSRRMPDGGVAVASFVVDVYCLGIKNCFWKAFSTFEYSEFLAKFEKGAAAMQVAPEYVVKLVTEAAAYARALGFPPHADYRRTQMVLAGIDPAKCTETFEFGKDGKPFYIQGPHETPLMVKSIVKRVAEHGGHYLVGLGANPNRLPVRILTMDDME